MRRIRPYLLSAGVAWFATVVGFVVWELAGDESFLTGSAPWLHIRHAHGFSYAHMPSLANKTAVVTGASSGLGLAVAKGLADAGCTVITTARTFDKCARTTKIIGSGTCVAMELLELKSVYRAARVAKEMAPSGIDFLVLNAGIMMPPLTLSTDGLEAQFQTNHLGHFVLTNEVLPLLNEGARVVAVSSVAHRFSSPDELWTAEKLNDPTMYNKLRWYGWSKLCNILMSRELHRRYDINAVAVHPGAVRGNLLRFVPAPWFVVRAFERLFYWDAATAALTVLRPLVDPTIEPGSYLVPVARPHVSSDRASDAELGVRLWSASEVLVADIRHANGNYSDVMY